MKVTWNFPSIWASNFKYKTVKYQLNNEILHWNVANINIALLHESLFDSLLKWQDNNFTAITKTGGNYGGKIIILWL